MRRILSILLALVLGMAPGLTAIPASALASGWTGKADPSGIPACCRKGGKHHCAMGAQERTEDPAREISVSAPNSCPFAPRTLASTAPSGSAFLQDAAATSLLPTEPFSFQNTANAAKLSDHRSQPKRGPPTDQLL